jgi:hypothetical protein
MAVPTFLDIFSHCGELRMFLCILRNGIYKWHGKTQDIRHHEREFYRTPGQSSLMSIKMGWLGSLGISANWLQRAGYPAFSCQYSSSSQTIPDSMYHLDIWTFKNHIAKEEIWFNQRSHYAFSQHQQTVTDVKSHYFLDVIPCWLLDSYQNFEIHWCLQTLALFTNWHGITFYETQI